MRLAVLDDDVSLIRRVAKLMAGLGHEISEFPDIELLTKALALDQFHLLILDCSAVGLGGPAVLGRIEKQVSRMPPTIMITEQGGDADIISCLAAGADDYILKPLQDDVLKARINALLRRTYGLKADKNAESYGQYTFDICDRAVKFQDSYMPMAAKEFALALLLFRNLDRPLSRGEILDAVWGGAADPRGRTLDAHISQVRVRLGLRPESGFRLSSVYGFGYCLEQLGSIGERRSPHRTEGHSANCMANVGGDYL